MPAQSQDDFTLLRLHGVTTDPNIHDLIVVPAPHRRLKNPDPGRVTVVEGDVLNSKMLTAAMQGQDVVYANLVGDMAPQARATVDAMHATGLKRLIFISSMGIYGEVRLEKYRSFLDPTEIRLRSSKRPTSTTRSCAQVGSRRNGNRK